MSRNGRLHVLQVGKYYPPHMGGIETHLQALCGVLQQKVHVEVLVASDQRHNEETWDRDIKVTRTGTLFNLSTAPVCPSMVRKIRDSKADIVHIHLPNPTAILAYLASGHRGRVIVTYHSDIVRQKLMGRAFAPVLRRVLNRCSVIIATSARYIDSSPVLSGYRDRCHVIPYGISTEQFNDIDDGAVATIQKQYGSRIVMSVGRLIYYKGFEHLIAAMKHVRGKLLIVGDGPLRQTLEHVAREHGVAERVVFLGEIQNEELAPYYHASNLFALASTMRSEAFGIVQLEAMACGKPVVNTDLDSGVPSVSLNHVSGITVPPANPRALADAINCLLDNPARSAAYGRAGQLRVAQHFSLQAMAGQMLTLYEEVMNSAPARRTATNMTIPRIKETADAVTAPAAMELHN